MATIQIQPTQDVSMRTSGFLGQTVWDTAHDSSTGVNFSNSHAYSDAASDITVRLGVRYTTSFGSSFFQIYRLYQDYDLSSIPGGSTITAAVINIKGATWGVVAGGAGENTNWDTIIIEGTYGSTLADTDLDSFTGFEAGWDGDAGDTDIVTYTSENTAWNESAYNQWTVNSTGIAALQSALNGGTRFKTVVMEEEHDYKDVAPTSPPTYFAGTYYTIRDSGNEPYIEITYTPPPAAGKITLNSGKLTLTSAKIQL